MRKLFEWIKGSQFMPRKKKSVFVFTGPLCAMVLLAGCAWGNETGSSKEPGSAVEEGSTVESSAVEEGSAVEESSAVEENSAGSSVEGSFAGNGAEQDTGEASGELTAEELEQFTDFVNRKENNGFLSVPFAGPEELDLNEVLYNGAGMEEEPLTEEERKKYEEECFPIETDITRLTGAQIDAFLQRKAGITMENVTKKLDWFYMEESDSYVFQHGDTNYQFFVCTGGRYLGEDIYEIICAVSEEYAFDDQERVVTLRKAGDDYQFISNIFQ